MIYKQNVIANIKITRLANLYKLEPLIMGGLLKVNKSQIARELDVDRRTVSKYVNGYEKPKKRVIAIPLFIHSILKQKTNH